MSSSGDDLPAPLMFRREVLEAGFSDGEIKRRRRAGELVTVRRGSYAQQSSVSNLDRVGRHRLMALAAAQASPGIPLSFVSAAAIWNMPLWGVELDRVHLTRPGTSGGRITRGRHDHSAALDEQDVTVVDGVMLTTAARTLVDLARREPPESVVIAADHALHTGIVAPTELAETLDACQQLPGARRAHRALRLADGRSESPGESRTRFHLRHLAGLDCQVEIRDGAGRLLGRADLGRKESATLVEFDGFVKYSGLLRPGQRPEDAVVLEKQREDAFRELGHLVIRVIWADFSDAPALANRVERSLLRGRQLVRSGRAPIGEYRPMPRIGI